MKSITFCLFALMLCSLNPLIGEAAKKHPLTAGMVAPNFNAADVFGNRISLDSLRGKKVILTLYRFVACPFCNLRFHQMQDQDSFFKAHGIILISVFESRNENILKYMEGQTVYPTMVSDTTAAIYNLYGSKKSFFRSFAALFHGGVSKISKGKKLYTSKMKNDGSVTRLGAEFLIDENGKIMISHYQKYVGDELSIDALKSKIN